MGFVVSIWWVCVDEHVCGFVLEKRSWEVKKERKKKKKKKREPKNPVKRNGKKKKKKKLVWKEKEKEEEEEASVKGKLIENSEKKKGSKVAVDLISGSLIVCLITEMPLKIELWKLKTPKMCFQFP